MNKNLPELPFKVKIASPCPARWEDMGGDHRVRFCDHCRKNVYNLSAMSAAEAGELLQSRGGNLCARIFQRADGTILTEDCPVGVARYWGRLKALAAAGVASIVLACATAFAISENRDDNENHTQGTIVSAARGAVDKARKWFGIKPPQPQRALMGSICVATPAPSPNANQTPLPPVPAK